MASTGIAPSRSLEDAFKRVHDSILGRDSANAATADALPLQTWLDERFFPASDSQDNGHEKQATLRSDILESEELQIMTRARELRILPITSSAHKRGEGYQRPSQMRGRASRLDEESTLLDAETKSLQHRLRHAKAAAQKVKQALKIARADAADIDKALENNESAIQELSLKADDAVQSATKDAAALSSSVPTHTPRALLASLASIRETLITQLTKRTQAINDAKAQIPSADHVRGEAARLARALRDLDPQGENSAFMECCARLEAGESLESILSQTDEGHRERSAEDDVHQALERAWTEDQLLLLSEEEAAVDELLRAIPTTLVDPLETLNAALTARAEHAERYEALMSGLTEEISDLAEDARHASTDKQAQPDVPHLEDDIRGLVERLKGMRPTETPPLVLLSPRDILDELRRASSPAEDDWIASLIQELPSLQDADAELLQMAYPHADTDLFGISSEERALESELKQWVINAQETAANIGALDARARRKLGAFVERWA